MTNLDPEVMAIFTRNVCSSASEATAKSGIEKIIPNMVIDDFLFQPCGYSMNGVSKSVRINDSKHAELPLPHYVEKETLKFDAIVGSSAKFSYHHI